ncbi:MAG: hypothetical protein KAH30_03335 [Caldisericia bacterium]|nr:hypothetical protein [Caldisericia bacterium]
MPKQGIVMILAAVVLVISIVVGLTGCKSKGEYVFDDESEHITLMLCGNSHKMNYGGINVNKGVSEEYLSAMIFDTKTQFDADNGGAGAFADDVAGGIDAIMEVLIQGMRDGKWTMNLQYARDTLEAYFEVYEKEDR